MIKGDLIAACNAVIEKLEPLRHFDPAIDDFIGLAEDYGRGFARQVIVLQQGGTVYIEGLTANLNRGLGFIKRYFRP